MLALIGCDKEDHGPGENSYWVIDNDTIAYRTIFVRTAPRLTELRVVPPLTENNELSFGFQMGSLPHSGTYRIDYTAPDTATMCNVYVTYNGINYDVKPGSNTTAVRVSTLSDGKARFELEPTWFYKQPDLSGDSILVRGVIIEP